METKEKNSNEFITALQDKLLGASGVVSSKPSALEATITYTIKGLEDSKATTQAGTQAKFDRLRIEANETGANAMTNELESRRGMGTNTAVVRQLTEATQKSLRDLDLRETEALALGNHEVATQIAGLKIQKLQFQQQAEEKAVSNMLSFIGVKTQSEENALRKEQFDMEMASNRIKFLQENDLISKSSPEEKRTLEAKFGLGTGVLDNLKSGEPLNLQTVAGVGLVNVSKDKNGNPKVTILQRAIKETSPVDAAQKRTSRAQDTFRKEQGTDFMNSSQTYVKAMNEYVSSGGTRNDFIREFAPALYLNANEILKLPNGLKPKSEGGTSNEELAK